MRTVPTRFRLDGYTCPGSIETFDTAAGPAAERGAEGRRGPAAGLEAHGALHVLVDKNGHAAGEHRVVPVAVRVKEAKEGGGMGLGNGGGVATKGVGLSPAGSAEKASFYLPYSLAPRAGNSRNRRQKLLTETEIEVFESLEILVMGTWRLKLRFDFIFEMHMISKCILHCS